MAGAGYKLFQTGDVLTAAQVNTYLNEQTVMVFANAAARTSALTSVLAEGMVSYLQDTNAVEVYNGSAWVGVSGAGDVTEVQAGVGISVASGTGPIPVITNSSTDLITTAGDLLYGTAADTVARLGIGTAGQVLKVNSGATAPEWGAAASGALTLIQRSTFTSVANTGTTFDGVFTSTYDSYQLVFENFFSATAADDLHFQLRYAGPTTQVGYTAQLSQNEVGSTSWTVVTSNPGNELVLCTDATSGNPFAGTLFCRIPSTSSNGFIYGLGTESYNSQICLVQGSANTGRTYTGFILKSASANVSGTVAVYGLAK